MTASEARTPTSLTNLSFGGPFHNASILKSMSWHNRCLVAYMPLLIKAFFGLSLCLSFCPRLESADVLLPTQEMGRVTMLFLGISGKDTRFVNESVGAATMETISHPESGTVRFTWRKTARGIKMHAVQLNGTDNATSKAMLQALLEQFRQIIIDGQALTFEQFMGAAAAKFRSSNQK